MKREKTIPYYSKKKKTWCVKIEMLYHGKKYMQTEKGTLSKVVCEYLRTCLYYPFWLEEERKEDNDFQPHAHSFDNVLSYLMAYPEHFSIEGFEEYYSKQEIELLEQFQKKLLEDLGKR